ncbi:AAA family ATPase [Stappia sp. GBMRC 2046]|uniref:AAA family ATPase n=1 Tax=Stappia sediminis TaxID=2692190 RepID=A0A7X3LSB2_9HYPH|nr:AAA family ATPase [Stappia sediminis]MXN64174.1 AAA family ATPase [Stappia sediminis]
MIISRIAELKQAGVWKDFAAAADLHLAPRTLIYGFNGSGKTTLSRVFSSMQRGSLEERLPTETAFKVEASDGTTVTQDPISNPFGNNLLVFNTDFVSRNFEWDSSSTKGIAYLSEKKVDARKEFDEIVPRLSAAKQKTKAKEKAKAKADKNLSEFKTRVARNIRELASSSNYTQSYDARKIQGHYSKAYFGAEKKLSEDDLKKHQGVLNQREPLPTLVFSPSLPDGLADWFKAGQSLLTQSVSGIALKAFEAHSDALRWVEKGLHYHNEHSLTDCLLCGNPFSEDRRAKLQTLFDKSWTEALRALEDAVKRGQEHQQALRELYRSIPKKAEITIDEREAFTMTRVSMETAIKQLGVCVGELLKGLEVRVANPTKEVLVTGELADFDLDHWLMEYATIEAALAAIVKKHNDDFVSFAAMQKDAFTKIEAHVLATNQSEWNRLQKDAQDAETELTTAQTDEKGLSGRQLELRNDLQDHGVGADKMNELIWAYLGHKELRLVAEDGGYKILRPSGKPATELSEGERTAVSFCFFLTQLAAEGRKLENLVLVIDDPISSLDTAARTYAYSLMTRMTKKCAQVIVLTHNTSFMNMVKREFQNLQKREDTKKVTALLSLDCRSSGEGNDRITSLARMHGLLVNFDSEYHYLFSLVQDAAHKKSTDYVFLLPNATRKLLEMFATFCSPGQASFAGALGDHHEAVKDKLDIRALERLIQIESHGTIDGLGTLPDLTLEEAIRAADAGIKFIKEVGKDHYKKMCAACKVE